MNLKTVSKIMALAGLLYACNNNAPQPNDAIRTAVLHKLTLPKDSLATFDSLLTQLDKEGVSFQKYISHSHYELSDSVTTVVETKFPEGRSRGDTIASELHYQLLSTAINKYDSSLGLNESQVRFAEYMFVSYDSIKNFCNNYMHPNTTPDVQDSSMVK